MTKAPIHVQIFMQFITRGKGFRGGNGDGPSSRLQVPRGCLRISPISDHSPHYHD